MRGAPPREAGSLHQQQLIGENGLRPLGEGLPAVHLKAGVFESSSLQGSHGPEDRTEWAKERLSPPFDASHEQLDLVVGLVEPAELDEGEDGGTGRIESDLIAALTGGD